MNLIEVTWGQKGQIFKNVGNGLKHVQNRYRTRNPTQILVFSTFFCFHSILILGLGKVQAKSLDNTMGLQKEFEKHDLELDIRPGVDFAHVSDHFQHFSKFDFF